METHSGKHKGPPQLCLRARHTPCWTAACWQSPVDLRTKRKWLQRNAYGSKSSSTEKWNGSQELGMKRCSGRSPKLNNFWGGTIPPKISKEKSSDATLCLYATECQGMHQQEAAKNRFWEKPALLPVRPANLWFESLQRELSLLGLINPALV